MQEDNFEKQVADKMEELRLSPSSKVWEGIEGQLKKDVYKKRFAFFMILLVGGIAAGILWNRTPFNEDVKKITANEPLSVKPVLPKMGESVTIPVPTGKSANVSTLKMEKTDEKSAVNNNIHTYGKSRPNIIAATLNQLPQTENKSVNKKINPSYNNDLISTNNRALIINPTTLSDNNSPEQILVTTGYGETKPEVIITDETVITAKTYPIVRLVQENGYNRIAKELTGSNGSLTNITGHSEYHVSTTCITPTPVQIRPEKSAWRFGLHVSGGLAVRQEEILSLKLSENKSLTSQDFLNAIPGNNSTSQANYAGWGAQTRINSQSSILPGASFSVNGFAERKLSKKISISAGLGYGYLSDRIKTGSMAQNSLSVVLDNNRVESFNKAYTAGENTSHTNRFHFIDLPVSLHWQVNNSQKLPLYATFTSQTSYLVAIKALHYNSGYNGIYIEYDEAFNKWQHKLGAGLMAGFHLKKMQFKAGPQLLINTNKVLQKQFLPKQYFINGGLAVQMYLK